MAQTRCRYGPRDGSAWLGQSCAAADRAVEAQARRAGSDRGRVQRVRRCLRRPPCRDRDRVRLRALACRGAPPACAGSRRRRTVDRRRRPAVALLGVVFGSGAGAWPPRLLHPLTPGLPPAQWVEPTLPSVAVAHHSRPRGASLRRGWGRRGGGARVAGVRTARLASSSCQDRIGIPVSHRAGRADAPAFYRESAIRAAGRPCQTTSVTVTGWSAGHPHELSDTRAPGYPSTQNGTPPSASQWISRCIAAFSPSIGVSGPRIHPNEGDTVCRGDRASSR